MNQVLLQQMAEERILDAHALQVAGRWAYAYYVAGYAVECGLKSCVLAQMIHTGGVFTHKKYAEECFTHDLQALVKLAGLNPMLNAELMSNVVFRSFWATVIAWQETSRYEPKTQADAETLYLAITDNTNGVLPWLRNYW